MKKLLLLLALSVNGAFSMEIDSKNELQSHSSMVVENAIKKNECYGEFYQKLSDMLNHFGEYDGENYFDKYKLTLGDGSKISVKEFLEQYGDPSFDENGNYTNSELIKEEGCIRKIAEIILKYCNEKIGLNELSKKIIEHKLGDDFYYEFGPQYKDKKQILVFIHGGPGLSITGLNWQETIESTIKNGQMLFQGGFGVLDKDITLKWITFFESLGLNIFSLNYKGGLKGSAFDKEYFEDGDYSDYDLLKNRGQSVCNQIKEIRAKNPDKEITVMGHSYGSSILLNSINFTELVSKVILSGIPYSQYNKGIFIQTHGQTEEDAFKNFVKNLKDMKVLITQSILDGNTQFVDGGNGAANFINSMNAAKKEGLTIEYFMSGHNLHNPYGQTKDDMLFDSVKYGLGKEESINLFDFESYLGGRYSEVCNEYGPYLKQTFGKEEISKELANYDFQKYLKIITNFINS